MILLLASLLIWTSLSIGGASGYENIKYEGLTSDVSNGGWNGIGKGFLNMFTPDRLTDEHWELIGKMKKNFDASLVQEFAFTMGGVVFLVVVSFLLTCCFCAAPISFCVYSCTCKKKCKPKSNAIVIYSGLACNSIAIITISVGILFCGLSIAGLKNGIESVTNSVEPLSGGVASILDKLKGDVQSGVAVLVSGLSKEVAGFPDTISDRISEIPELKKLMAIDFTKKKDDIKEFFDLAVELDGDLVKTQTELQDLKTSWSDTAAHPTLNQFANVFDQPLQHLSTAQSQITAVKDMLAPHDPLAPPPTGTSVSQKLNDVQEQQQKGSKAKIKAEIEEKIKPVSDKIDKLTTDIDKQIDNGFNQTSVITKEISTVTGKIKSAVDKATEHLSYLYALMLVIFPCYLVLGSAVWSCCTATKFVQKKKAKPVEKGGLLIPLFIGFGLAFLPLIVSTVFMTSAGVVNVVCNTVFEDESFGFLTQALSAFDQDPSFTIKGTKVEIQSVIQECRSQKPLISALKGDMFFDENMVIKKFDIAAKKTEIDGKINGMSFTLPSAAGLTAFEGELLGMTLDGQAAQTQLTTIAQVQVPKLKADGALVMPPETVPLKDLAPTTAATIEKMNTFMTKVDAFKTQCDADILAAKTALVGLSEAAIKKMIKDMMLGDPATPTIPGLLQEMLNKIDADYKTFRTELLTQSTNCDFLFLTFKSIGTVACDQALGGFNGLYAAIGLAVMSFFSAAIGTLMIWHSLRAGKGPKEENSDESNKKNKKKKDGDEEEESPNMAGKIGEQAQPMAPGQPVPSEPTPPPGQVPPPLIQAVLTDPAAPGEKTNPSLLPNDAPMMAAGAAPESGPTAGTPLSPNPIQMVKMETNNDQDDKQNSITGAGGETAGGGATAQ